MTSFPTMVAHSPSEFGAHSSVFSPFLRLPHNRQPQQHQHHQQNHREEQQFQQWWQQPSAAAPPATTTATATTFGITGANTPSSHRDDIHRLAMPRRATNSKRRLDPVDRVSHGLKRMHVANSARQRGANHGVMTELCSDDNVDDEFSTNERIFDLVGTNELTSGVDQPSPVSSTMALVPLGGQGTTVRNRVRTPYSFVPAQRHHLPPPIDDSGAIILARPQTRSTDAPLERPLRLLPVGTGEANDDRFEEVFSDDENEDESAALRTTRNFSFIPMDDSEDDMESARSIIERALDDID